MDWVDFIAKHTEAINLRGNVCVGTWNWWEGRKAQGCNYNFISKIRDGTRDYKNYL